MKKRAWPLVVLAAISAVTIAGQTVAFGAASGNQSVSTTQDLAFQGTFTVAGQSAGTATPGTTDEIPPHEPNSKTIRHTAASGVPSVSTEAVTTSQLPGFAGFSGLTHRDQRLSGTGAYTNTQFSLEPPDQGLCVGNGRVVEAVNNAMRVFDTSGKALSAPVSLSQFFGTKPEEIRSPTNPPVFGDFVGDPKCYFDPDTARWFLTELLMSLDPVTGDFAAPTAELIAVSQTSDPLDTWSLFRLNTTDDGTNGTPSDPGCPCFGDQPLIGADANGFYVSTNEYTISTFAFNGAQVYAFSKKGLEAASKTVTARAVHIAAGPMLLASGGLAYSIQPATAPAAHYETANGGTEYFLSGLDFGDGPAIGTRASQLAVWALTNTSSLSSKSPSVSLTNVVINSELYSQPPNATQKSGVTPLGDALHDPLELIAANDDRQNQVVFAAGHLWSAVNTSVKEPNGATVVGLAYFVVTPSDPSGTLSASVASQGYVAVQGDSLLFPSIGVTDAGKAVMAFSLVGPDSYPSAAYAPLDLTSGVGSVRIAVAGTAPEDGFSGYKPFAVVNGVARWGDYSAAVADTSGTIWMGAEYIPNAPRTSLANWGTFVSHVTP